VVGTEQRNYAGLISEGQVILKTDDGGLTWNFQYRPPIRQEGLNAVTFLSPDIGFAVGRHFVEVPMGFRHVGIVLLTTDGGGTWTRQNFEQVDNLVGLSFLDETIGWMVGSNFSVYNTTTGGM
jgi:photosystem II stability/assembly factor-like uncharacterized protein